jgi:hypothetical protein
VLQGFNSHSLSFFAAVSEEQDLVAFFQRSGDNVDDLDDPVEVIPQKGLFQLAAFTENPLDDVVDFLHRIPLLR